MKETTIHDWEIESVQRAAGLLQDHLKHPLTIAELAARVKISEPKLKRTFKHVYGMGPYAYVIHLRMEKAKSLLLEGHPIKAIVSTIGYQTESNFCKAFRKSFNESPMVWMKAQLSKTG